MAKKTFYVPTNVQFVAKATVHTKYSAVTKVARC